MDVESLAKVDEGDFMGAKNELELRNDETELMDRGSTASILNPNQTYARLELSPRTCLLAFCRLELWQFLLTNESQRYTVYQAQRARVVQSSGCAGALASASFHDTYLEPPEAYCNLLSVSCAHPLYLGCA